MINERDQYNNFKVTNMKFDSEFAVAKICSLCVHILGTAQPFDDKLKQLAISIFTTKRVK